MNRIYQSRVSKVEIPDGKDNWQPLDLDPNIARDHWQAFVPVPPELNEGGWQHHELFHDAVNSSSR